METSIGTQYYLADCLEHIGRTASAWAMFVEAADGARRAHDEGRERKARERARSLEKELAHLTIDVAERDVDGLEVRRGAVHVGAGQLGVAVPVDPGDYVVHASAPGRAEWSKTIAVAKGEMITVRIPRLDAASPPGTATSTRDGARLPHSTPNASSVSPDPDPVPSAPSLSARLPETATPNTPLDGTTGGLGLNRKLAVAAGATGAAALAAAGVLALVARGAAHDSSGPGLCTDDVCTSAGLDKRNHALHLADAATVASIAGGVLLATGVVLWVTAPTAAARTVALEVGVQAGSVAVRGRLP